MNHSFQNNNSQRLGVLLPGMGAVATTFIAGCLAIRKGLSAPTGSVSQLGHLPDENKSDNNLIRNVLPVASMNQLVFGGWDIFEDSMYKAAKKADVLDRRLLKKIKKELKEIRPMRAVFNNEYVKNLQGTHIKEGTTKMELADQLMADIEAFKKENHCSRLVMIWCGSTEKFIEKGDVHSSLSKLEAGLKSNDPAIPPSMIYAYAALKCGVPYANGAPNLSCDVPALIELSALTGTPIAGKDFKTGQTLMKTMIAPGIKARYLGVDGWFSTNILGNRDGEVLDDPESFKSKEVSKLSVLDQIFEPKVYPDLYGKMHHKVRINYYPPRGDNKEGWDNIDIRGWLDYPMQIKVDFLCRDSILAAPIVLDLALFLDLAAQNGESGVQKWLSFYFKSPQEQEKGDIEHDLFKQEKELLGKLKSFVPKRELVA